MQFCLQSRGCALGSRPPGFAILYSEFFWEQQSFASLRLPKCYKGQSKSTSQRSQRSTDAVVVSISHFGQFFAFLIGGAPFCNKLFTLSRGVEVRSLHAPRVSCSAPLVSEKSAPECDFPQKAFCEPCRTFWSSFANREELKQLTDLCGFSSRL